jgi:nicotinamide-nucleotide amidase
MSNSATNSLAFKEKLVEIITIGDEILIGQIVDTNSAFIATLLNMSGLSVKQISSVSDNADHIIKALDEAKSRADVILITGGLGPTKDDITKKTLCKYFNTAIRFDEGAYNNVERIFASYGREVTPLNRLQAEVPAICTVLNNPYGTAPGMWFDVNDIIYVSMPGVPYEMKHMMQEEVMPKIKKRFALPCIIHKTVLTQGVGESFLSELISNWENSLSEQKIKLAYLPSIDTVRLRLSIKGNDENELNEIIDKKIEELKLIIPQYIIGYEVYGQERETIEQIAGKLLREKNKTVATAESCTGGYIAHLITKIAGSSDYYKGSVIAYSNQIKQLELGVSETILKEHGAVSKMVVEQMASAIRKKMDTDYGIATSGIAGPTGGTDKKPVGTVWIAVASQKGVVSQKFLFGKIRERNIQKAANAALTMLKKEVELV